MMFQHTTSEERSPLTLPTTRTSGVRENGLPSPLLPRGEERRSRCLARAINRSLLTEFAAVRGFKVRNFISAKSLPKGEGRGEGEEHVNMTCRSKNEMLPVIAVRVLFLSFERCSIIVSVIAI